MFHPSVQQIAQEQLLTTLRYKFITVYPVDSHQMDGEHPAIGNGIPSHLDSDILPDDVRSSIFKSINKEYFMIYGY